MNSIIKPILLYGSDCWKDSLTKKDLFCNKHEKFHLYICKKKLRKKKNVMNMKDLAEIGRVPFKINIETQMFKDLQRFPFFFNFLYLHKVFHEHTHLEHINKHGCVNHIKIIVELYNSNNIFLNLINLLLGKSVKLIINVSINFSNKKPRGNTAIQQYFPRHINREENRNLSQRCNTCTIKRDT